MKRLGHSSPAAAMRYLHTVNGRDEAIAERPVGARRARRRGSTAEVGGDPVMVHVQCTWKHMNALACGFVVPENRKVVGSTPPLATPEAAGHMRCDDLRFRGLRPLRPRARTQGGSGAVRVAEPGDLPPRKSRLVHLVRPVGEAERTRPGRS
jgi:hypothetical protein